MFSDPSRLGHHRKSQAAITQVFGNRTQDSKHMNNGMTKFSSANRQTATYHTPATQGKMTLRLSPNEKDSEAFQGDDSMVVAKPLSFLRPRTTTEVTIPESESFSDLENSSLPDPTSSENDVWELLDKIVEADVLGIEDEQIELQRRLDTFPSARKLVASIQRLQSHNKSLIEENDAQIEDIFSLTQQIDSSFAEARRWQAKYSQLQNRHEQALDEVQRQKEESTEIMRRAKKWVKATRAETKKHLHTLTTWFQLQLHECGMEKHTPADVNRGSEPVQPSVCLKRPAVDIGLRPLCDDSNGKEKDSSTTLVTISTADDISFCAIPLLLGKIVLEETSHHKSLFDFSSRQGSRQANAFLVAGSKNCSVPTGHRLVALEKKRGSSLKSIQFNQYWSVSELRNIMSDGSFCLTFRRDPLTVGEQAKLNQTIKVLETKKEGEKDDARKLDVESTVGCIDSIVSNDASGGDHSDAGNKSVSAEAPAPRLAFWKGHDVSSTQQSRGGIMKFWNTSSQGEKKDEDDNLL